MPAPTPVSRTEVASFLHRTTMQSILSLDQQALDHVMATAYSLYQAGRYVEVDVLCRGLIAADHTYWWSYSLHAAALRRMGRLSEALKQVDKGLEHEPNETKLQLMRGEILAALGGWQDRTVRAVAPDASASVAVGG
jgi:predicted Zn-dependent protease